LRVGLVIVVIAVDIVILLIFLVVLCLLGSTILRTATLSLSHIPRSQVPTLDVPKAIVLLLCALVSKSPKTSDSPATSGREAGWQDEKDSGEEEE
jgi:hypothetical protein